MLTNLAINHAASVPKAHLHHNSNYWRDMSVRETRLWWKT